MDVSEARLRIHEGITGILLDLAFEPDDEVSELEYSTTKDGMGDVVDMIFEQFDFQIIDITDGKVTATLRLGN